MNNTIRQLLDQINALEVELRTALHEQESKLSYQVNGKRVEFERAIRHARKVLGSHERYARFLGYGEAADYHGKLEAYRNALEEKPAGAPPKN